MNLRKLITRVGLTALVSGVFSVSACSPRQEQKTPTQEQALYYSTQHTPFATFNNLIKKLQDRDTSQVSLLISKELMDSLYQGISRNPEFLDRQKLEEQTDKRTADFIIYSITRDPSLYPRVFLENFNLTKYDLSKVKIYELSKWVKENSRRSQTLVTILLGQLNESTGLVEDVFGHTYSEDHVDLAMVNKGNTWGLVPIHDDQGLGECREVMDDFAYSPSKNLMAFHRSTFGFDPETNRQKEITAGIYLSYSNGDSLVSLQDALPEELKQRNEFLAKLEGDPKFLSERKKEGKTFYTLKYRRTVGFKKITNPNNPRRTSIKPIEKETTVEFPFPN